MEANSSNKAWIESLVVTAESATTIITGQATLIGKLTESVGQLMLPLEERGDLDAGTESYLAGMRSWLLDVKRLESDSEDMIKVLEDVKILRRILPQ